MKKVVLTFVVDDHVVDEVRGSLFQGNMSEAAKVLNEKCSESDYDIDMAEKLPKEQKGKKKASLNDVVSIICYNQQETMLRKDAIKKYAECMACSEGSERDRYVDIYMQLMAGYTECHD